MVELKETVEREKNEFVKKFEAEISDLTDQIVNVVESKNVFWQNKKENFSQSLATKDFK